MSHKPTHPNYPCRHSPICPCRHSPTNSYFSPQVFYHHPPQHYTHLSFTSFPPRQQSSSHLPKHADLLCPHILGSHLSDPLCPKQTLHFIVYHNYHNKQLIFSTTTFFSSIVLHTACTHHISNWFATLNTFSFRPYPTDLHTISASKHSLPCRSGASCKKIGKAGLSCWDDRVTEGTELRDATGVKGVGSGEG